MQNYAEKRKEIYYQNQRNSASDHYIDIVERSCGEEPTSAAKQSYLTDDINIVDHIIWHYEDHPSVKHNKER